MSRAEWLRSPAALLLVAALAGPSRAAASKTELATFAGGCFWCLETQFEGRPGVVSAVSGYTGGTVGDPTYEEVCSGRTGHLESVQVTFDPARITYAQLLDIFWHSIDPTQADGQFCDRGPQYHTAVFVHDATQRRLAEESKRRLATTGGLRKTIVTVIRDATIFWPAEEYHQDFYRKNPERYCSYRDGCGRDQTLQALWGKDAAKPSAH
jgi:peptide-methionine (S)-S-oxide reductase